MQCLKSHIKKKFFFKGSHDKKLEENSKALLNILSSCQPFVLFFSSSKLFFFFMFSNQRKAEKTLAIEECFNINNVIYLKRI